MASMTIKYKNRVYDVQPGFTPAEQVESLAVAHPELTNAKLIDEGNGRFTVKALTGEKG